MRYVKCLLTNMQKEGNMLRMSLSKFTDLTHKCLKNFYDQECEIFRVLLFKNTNIQGDFQIYISVPLSGYKSSPSEVFLVKGVLKTCSKFTREHPCRRAILLKLLCNFIEIALRHGCSPVNSLLFSEHLFLRTPLDGCFCEY